MWVVKLKRWDGSESLMLVNVPLEEAQAYARKMNTDTQSSNYRIEKYDPVKAQSFFRVS